MAAQAKHRPANCCDCGTVFQRQFPTTIRCDSCHEKTASKGKKPPAQCANCGSEFTRGKGRKSDLCDRCRAQPKRVKAVVAKPRKSRTQTNREWRERNRERNRTQRRDWIARNREKVRSYKRQYEDRRRKTDGHYNVISKIRSRIATAIRDATTRGQRVTLRGAMRLVGCPVNQLIAHIEAQFSEGMSWQNFGQRGWHIDHIFPIGRADLTDSIELRAVFNWQNCRPLWGEENLAKNDRVSLEARGLFERIKRELDEGR